MTKLSPNVLGSLYMTIGSLGYVLNDAFVRRVTEDGPEVYQVLFLRSVGLAVLFAGAGQLRGEVPSWSQFRRPLSTRVLAETVASALFFAAVVRIEFANAQAILLVVPFAITLVAAVFLREPVSGRQYLTVLVGFLGVMLVIRPATSGFSVWSLAVVASAVFLVIREVATRDVQAEVPALAIAFWTAVGLAILTGLLSLFEGWASLSAAGVGFLVLAMVSLVVGYLFSIETVRVGDLSVSAPFRYTVLVGAVVMGYLLFDEVPDVLTISGSCVIVATGIYAVYLERQNSAAATA